MSRLYRLIVCMALAFALAACGGSATTTAPPPSPTPERVQYLVPDVLASFPHDETAFTQGLLLHEGSFYESTGQYGASNVRQVNPQTGDVLRQTDLSSAYFGEGLALVDDRLIQITWREGEAFVYSLETLEVIGVFEYEGEGWGLCYDGQILYMSDGSATIFQRDPISFEITGQMPVTLEGEPVERINELECVGDSIYANVWLTDTILRIDKATGDVRAVIDASALLDPAMRTAMSSNAVLNGIAYNADNDTFFVTGKWWPLMFEVRFVPANR